MFSCNDVNCISPIQLVKYGGPWPYAWLCTLSVCLWKAWGRYHVIFFNPSCPTLPIIGRHTKNLDQYKAANMHKWSVLFSLHGKNKIAKKWKKNNKTTAIKFCESTEKKSFSLLSMRQMCCYIYIIYKYIYTCPFWVSLLSPVALSNIKHVQ